DLSGVEIFGSGTAGNLVQGNFIGVGSDGLTALGNASHGVGITNQASSNNIGGTQAGAGNVIAHNGGDGVLIGSDPGAGYLTAAGNGNSGQGNRIFANAGVGIDLGANDGATANDSNDPDSGPNDLLNFPVLTAAVLLGSDLSLTGSINTQTNKQLRIEFFASPSADPSGNGEGQAFLGFLQVDTTSGETVSFSTTLSVSGVQVGQVITATATDELGNTSEFSIAPTVA